MRLALFGVLLLGAACAANPPASAPPDLPAIVAPAQDGAGNRLEPLVAEDGRYCTADGAWCVEAHGAATHAGRTHSIPLMPENQERSVWPFVVVNGGAPDRALVGFLETQYEAYSGGGASFTSLTLYEMGGDAPEPALTTMIASNKMIRACFGEADARPRRGACHDEYQFLAQLNLDQTNASGPPRFIYTSTAATFPGDLSLDVDSAERGPLRASDMVWLVDEGCAVTRTFARGADGAYQPDEALPECGDYSPQ